MKKLLLLIVPLLLLFGVSLGETRSFTIPDSSLASRNIDIYEVSLLGFNIYLSQNAELVSITTDDLVGYNCRTKTGLVYTIYEITGSNYSTRNIIKTGSFDGMNNTVISVNTNLTGKTNYRISYTSPNGNTSCGGKSIYNQVVWYNSGILTLLPPYQQNYNSSNTTAIPDALVFSGTSTATSITIHYNGTSVSFAGSNIYLTDLFHNYTMSGSDIVFQPYVYRALFRSH